MAVEGSPSTEDPLALPSKYIVQWLVLFFTGYEKWIPTPREIFGEVRRARILFEGGGSGKNIGFESDLKYAGKWRSGRNGRRYSTEQKYRDEFMLDV